MNPSARASVPVTGFLLTLLGAVLFSTKAIIVKLAFGATHTDALTLLTLRMAFALPFYAGAALLVSSQKANVRMTGVQWLLVAVLVSWDITSAACSILWACATCRRASSA